MQRFQKIHGRWPFLQHSSRPKREQKNRYNTYSITIETRLIQCIRNSNKKRFILKHSFDKNTRAIPQSKLRRESVTCQTENWLIWQLGFSANLFCAVLFTNLLFSTLRRTKLSPNRFVLQPNMKLRNSHYVVYWISVKAVNSQKQYNACQIPISALIWNLFVYGVN